MYSKVLVYKPFCLLFFTKHAIDNYEGSGYTLILIISSIQPFYHTAFDFKGRLLKNIKVIDTRLMKIQKFKFVDQI